MAKLEGIYPQKEVEVKHSGSITQIHADMDNPFLRVDPMQLLAVRAQLQDLTKPIIDAEMSLSVIPEEKAKHKE